tara:strand:+ start:10310 stop:11041 length:732 start_codon:yes stop_codon:yes gene_type:complete
MTRRFLWLFYDHLGGVVLCNLLWSLINIPYVFLAHLILQTGLSAGTWSSVGGILVALIAAFLSPPSLIVYWVGASWVRRREVHLKEAWSLLKAQFIRAQILQLILVVASVALILNAAFYVDFAGLFGLFLAALMGWLVVATGLVGLYCLPLLVTQDTGVWQTLRQSLLLAVTHPGFSLKGGIVFLLFLALGAVSGIGFFCGLFVAWSLWFNTYLRGMLMEYTGESWGEEEERSLREIIRPWES